MTTSKISKCPGVHFSKEFGTSQRKVFPSRTIQAEGMIKPSARWIPSVVAVWIWTAGTVPPARRFSRGVGVRREGDVENNLGVEREREWLVAWASTMVVGRVGRRRGKVLLASLRGSILVVGCPWLAAGGSKWGAEILRLKNEMNAFAN